MTESILPPIVYKYEAVSIQSLLNLKRQKIYFGSPKNFNDPYDCAINATIADPPDSELEQLKATLLQTEINPTFRNNLNSISLLELKQQILRGAQTGLQDAKERFLATNGVTCFSEVNDNHLMWGHYGDRYRGFCLGFKTSIDPFTKLCKVKYAKTMPQIDIVQFVRSPDSVDLLDLFCTKSEAWEYEKEWRGIHHEAGKEFGYETDCLSAVYFGPDINPSALEIICLILQGQNETVQFFRGTRSQTEFKVEFQAITYTSYLEAKRKGMV